MAPAIVFRRGEAVFGSFEFEGQEALHAMLASSDPSEAVDAKLEIENDMAERGLLPLVVISFEDLAESRIDEINASSPLSQTA